MYSEQSIIDTINARDTGHIEIRTSNRVLKDGVIISTTYHRHVLSPGDDLTSQDPRVCAVAGANWTPEQCKAATAAIVALSKAETATRNAAKAECDAACHEAKDAAEHLEEANARLKAAKEEAKELESA